MKEHRLYYLFFVCTRVYIFLVNTTTGEEMLSHFSYLQIVNLAIFKRGEIKVASMEVFFSRWMLSIHRAPFLSILCFFCWFVLCK